MHRKALYELFLRLKGKAPLQTVGILLRELCSVSQPPDSIFAGVVFSLHRSKKPETETATGPTP